MSSDDQHTSPKMSALRARLDKFETVEDFISGYSQYFFRGGILLPTRHAKPEGTPISMQIEIAGGETVLRAEGEVKQVRRNEVGRAVGMVIRFSRLDARSREIVERVLAHKQAMSETGSMQVVIEKATARRANSGDAAALGERDLDAIADAIDDTFDSIFAGAPEPTVSSPAVSDDDHIGIDVGAFDEGEETDLSGFASPSFAEAGDLGDPPTQQVVEVQTHSTTPALFDDDQAAELRAALTGDHDAAEDEDALEAIKQIAAALDAQDVDPDEPATQQVPRLNPSAPSRTVFGMPAFEADRDEAADGDIGGDSLDDEPFATALDLFAKAADADQAADLTDKHDAVDALPVSHAAADFLRATGDALPDAAGNDDDEEDDDALAPPTPRTDPDDDLRAAITGAYDAIDAGPISAPVLSTDIAAPPRAPKGVFARFMAWLRRLFGG